LSAINSNSLLAGKKQAENEFLDDFMHAQGLRRFEFYHALKKAEFE